MPSKSIHEAVIAQPRYIRGPQLRKRWNLPNSTFYYKLKNGQIPPPVYPFGPAMPVWELAAIERAEAAAA